METVLHVPQGQFQLQRLPLRQPELLRAWDAADEYLLQHVAEQRIPEHARLLIVNDGFGALALALAAWQPIAISDSWLSQQATRLNLAANQLSAETVIFQDSLSPVTMAADYVLLKIPKTLALLEYQLHQLRPVLQPSTVIIAAGMVKNLSDNVWKLLEKLVGPTTTSLAVKKARLIKVKPDLGIVLPANPYPSVFGLPEHGWQVLNHANVFSRAGLDIGTRFLLQHLPEVVHGHWIDLGCGNGLVGMALAQRGPAASLCFVDESFMALASARHNYQQLAGRSGSAEFIAADCLTGFAAASADGIVCNPPFHQQHGVGDQIASQMFKQAWHVLKRGGELRVIGNRHLNYHFSLKKLFGHCHLLASNAKFVIFSCRKP